MHFKLVDSKQNRCMNFVVAKHSCDIVFLSEFYNRILTNQLVSISNNILDMIGEFNLFILHEKCNLFLN